jgi:hypothetical protein
MEEDLCALANAMNEWFPSWEFKGSHLTFEDLVGWGVVKPEWGFGGRGARTRRGTDLRSSTRSEGGEATLIVHENGAPRAAAEVGSKGLARVDGVPTSQAAEQPARTSESKPALDPSEA